MRVQTRRTSGWSTVELMASVTVLLFGLLALAAGFHGSAVLAEKARQHTSMKLGVQNVVAELGAADLTRLPVDFGSGSGQENFYLGDDNGDAVAERKLFFTPPAKLCLSGTIRLYTDEASLPASWSGFSGGLDLNGDGILSDLLNVVLGLLGLLGGGGGGGGSIDPARVLPAEIACTVDGVDGPFTLVTGVIIGR